MLQSLHPRFTRHPEAKPNDYPSLFRTILAKMWPPAALAVVLTAVRLVLLRFDLTAQVEGPVSTALASGYWIAGGWALVRGIDLGSTIILRHNAEPVSSNASSLQRKSQRRAIRTRVVILRRMLVAVAVIVAAAFGLLQFQAVKSVGVSLLASAGLAGAVIGLAAQKSIGAFLAGLQLTITQPIRVGDMVIVESKLGKVDDIHLTYAVVLLESGSKLIVPTTKFLDASFERLPPDASFEEWRERKDPAAPKAPS
jgi:small-conductance mechanosensitive channel